MRCMSVSVSHMAQPTGPFWGKYPGTIIPDTRRTRPATSSSHTTAVTTVNTGTHTATIGNTTSYSWMVTTRVSTISAPGISARKGSSPTRTAPPENARWLVSAPQVRIPPVASGESSGQVVPALPWWRRGEPPHSSPAGTARLTWDPGSTSAPAPTCIPGSTRVRVPTRACSPISIAPTWKTSPSSQ